MKKKHAFGSQNAGPGIQKSQDSQLLKLTHKLQQQFFKRLVDLALQPSASGLGIISRFFVTGLPQELAREKSLRLEAAKPKETRFVKFITEFLY